MERIINECIAATEKAQKVIEEYRKQGICLTSEVFRAIVECRINNLLTSGEVRMCDLQVWTGYGRTELNRYTKSTKDERFVPLAQKMKIKPAFLMTLIVAFSFEDAIELLGISGVSLNAMNKYHAVLREILRKCCNSQITLRERVMIAYLVLRDFGFADMVWGMEAPFSEDELKQLL